MKRSFIVAFFMALLPIDVHAEPKSVSQTLVVTDHLELSEIFYHGFDGLTIYTSFTEKGSDHLVLDSPRPVPHKDIIFMVVPEKVSASKISAGWSFDSKDTEVTLISTMAPITFSFMGLSGKATTDFYFDLDASLLSLQDKKLIWRSVMDDKRITIKCYLRSLDDATIVLDEYRQRITCHIKLSALEVKF